MSCLWSLSRPCVKKSGLLAKLIYSSVFASPGWCLSVLHPSSGHQLQSKLPRSSVKRLRQLRKDRDPAVCSKQLLRNGCTGPWPLVMVAPWALWSTGRLNALCFQGTSLSTTLMCNINYPSPRSMPRPSCEGASGAGIAFAVIFQELHRWACCPQPGLCCAQEEVVPGRGISTSLPFALSTDSKKKKKKFIFR